MAIRIGDSVVDINPTWARYQETGTVVSVKNNRIKWKSNVDGHIILDEMKDLRKITHRGVSTDRGKKRKGLRINKTVKEKINGYKSEKMGR